MGFESLSVKVGVPMGKNELKNKIFVVSGASSGLGRLIAEKLIGNDCVVFGIGRSEEKFRKFKEESGEKSKLFHAEIFDVTVKENWLKLAADIKESYGHIDGIINCAGVFPPFKKATGVSSEDAEKVMKTNFFSAVYAIETLFCLTEGVKKPIIVNVSSSSALCSIVGTSAYSASKSALKAYSEILGEELRGKAYVATVMPGFARTDIFRSQNTSFEENKLLYKMSMPAEKMANKIFKGIEKGKRRMIFGFDAKLMNFFYKLMPKTTTKIICKILKKSELKLFEDIFE